MTQPSSPVLDQNAQRQSIRMAIGGAALTIGGILLSGPIGLAIVSMVQPAQRWEDAEVFAANYHWIQSLPFFAGIVLIFGYVMLMAGIHGLAEDPTKARALVAVMLTMVYAALIAFNYLCQTTLIPALVRSYRSEYDPIITAFSLANPLSLAWAVEMWGYALLGGATWFAASVFDRGGIERLVALLMRANGVISVAGAIAAAVNLSWGMTRPGMVSYVGWNVIALLLSIGVVVALLQRLRDGRDREAAYASDLLGIGSVK